MKQFLVIGAGKFGAVVATSLYKLGYNVMMIDENQKALNKVSNFVTHTVQGDATNERTIQALGISNFDTVIMALGSDIQASMLITIMLKELGAKHIVVKAHNELHAKTLYKLGVNEIVFPEKDMGARLAQSLSSTNIMDYIELSPEYSIVEVADMDEWVGRSLVELDIREKFGINVMAIKQKGNLNLSPNASTIIESGDVLIVVGHNKDLRKLEKI